MHVCVRKCGKEEEGEGGGRIFKTVSKLFLKTMTEVILWCVILLGKFQFWQEQALLKEEHFAIQEKQSDNNKGQNRWLLVSVLRKIVCVQ